ncbi:SPRY domain-containing SOCS box protein 4-like [Chiloscyllium plagiosum]|uniref:SPRY domain-containing SOCS box protein 4-like n=1 Tax=Chiloscyllium plagiosum TaxID=36176 RepID=UPI001CB80BC5|nr:SPRY domain-containing SOCS box protein 4-like [Chiloscyllium plagiosum]
MGLKLIKPTREETEQTNWKQRLQQFKDWHVPTPANLELLLDLPPVPMEVQLCHAWSRWDRSPNMCQPEGATVYSGLTVRRNPVQDSTDCARGSVGYRRGLHVWRVRWPPGERGSHAAIGVGTAHAPLHHDSYRVLLGGGDGESWGWELGANRLHGGGRDGRRYPEVAEEPLPVPESFLAVLDCDGGTLSFLVDGVYLGVAFDGLKGKTLYPMVSCVWGNASITLTYLNGLERQPLRLADLSRQRIRQSLGQDRISEVASLPLPPILQTYLRHS